MSRLICAVCPTFNRPELLSRAIRSFEKQTYENRYLVVVDDLGQYENQEGDRWEIVSIPRRILSLGEKRNFGSSMAPIDTWAYAVWDDDDLYMPWHLEALVEALGKGIFVQPRYAVDYWNDRWVVVETFRRKLSSKRRVPHNKFDFPTYCYHGCWGYTRELFSRVGGYRHCFADDDVEFQRRLISLGIKSVGFSKDYKPSYFYNRQHEIRVSEQGKNKEGYQEMGAIEFPYIGKVPKWEDDSIWEQRIPTEVIERQF